MKNPYSGSLRCHRFTALSIHMLAASSFPHEVGVDELPSYVVPIFSRQAFLVNIFACDYSDRRHKFNLTKSVLRLDGQPTPQAAS